MNRRFWLFLTPKVTDFQQFFQILDLARPGFELFLAIFHRFQACFGAPDQWIHARAATILIVSSLCVKLAAALRTDVQPKAQKK